ncbi:RidA family protein [Sciscionella sediminilitoris]|uniref:RidA family protein n=1 Tax=Sciscionella sediminilitoris TaxID=1445613 RepID=UPI0004DF3FAA|nr:RidA family protein [Sciscionella sp. SE31]
MAKQAFSSPNAPSPAAKYSPAVRKGNMLQISGQVGFDPSGTLVGDSVDAQTRQAFANVNTLLAEAGASIDDVIMLRVYLTDPGHFAEMNAAFAEYVTEPFPARTTVYTGLNPGILVEIDALAVLD